MGGPGNASVEPGASWPKNLCHLSPGISEFHC